MIGLRGLPEVIGGVETLCEHVYPRVVADSPSTEITSLIRRGYTERNRFHFQGVDVRALWAPRIWGVDTLIHTLWALIYARAALAPDLVHLHGIGPGFFTPLARLLGFTTVVTHHAPDYERPKWGRRGRLFLKTGERFTARWADAVICVSEALSAQFLARYPGARERTRVIRNAGVLDGAGSPNPSGVLEELEVTPGGFLLAVGRLEATKAFDELVTAFERARLAGLKLVIVGSDAGNIDYAQALLARAAPDVIFAGLRTGDALRRLYEAAALFVHPSRMEGYGLVVGEALSVGSPMLVSDIAPHREFGLNESCYFPAGDIGALTSALAVPDYDLYRSPEAASRQRSDSWERVAREHVALYADLLPRPAGDTPETEPGVLHHPSRT